MVTTVNRENLIKVAEAIETSQRFDLTRWVSGGWDWNDVVDKVLHNCDTTACVGGWAQIVLAPDTFEYYYGEEDNIANLFGITFEQADELCYPQVRGSSSVWGKSPSLVTADDAAAMLRSIADGTAHFHCDDV